MTLALIRIAKLVSILLLAPALSACGSARAPEQVVSIPPSLPEPAASSAAPVAASPKEKEAPEGADPACSDEAFKVAMTAVEEAAAGGDRAAMRQAIDAALDLRATDPGLRARSMELHLAAGEASEAEVEAEILAQVSDGKSAAAWLVLGRAARAEGKQELGRALLARSARLDPAGEAARLLGPASRCTALALAPDKGDRLAFVTGWKAVWAAVEPSRMVHEDLPDPGDEAAARARVCVSGDLSTIFARDVCGGPGPWHVNVGHLHFHDMRKVVVPFPGRRFAVVDYMTGEYCRGGRSLEVSVEGGVVVVATTDYGSLEGSTGRCDPGGHDALAGPCLPRQSAGTTFYDAATGKALLFLADHEHTEKLQVKGWKVRRTGPAGCDETLDLRRLPAHLR